MDSTQFRFERNSGLPLRKSMERKSRNISCSNCSQIFSVRDPLHPRGLRCPLILHCGHSACENCVRTSLRKADRVVCGICKHMSIATHQTTDIRLNFPLNIYLLGVFAAQHWGQEPEDSKITFVSQSATSNNRKTSASKGMHQSHKTEICSECMERNADWKCHQCEVLYCGECFNKVHKAARALSKHQKSPVDETSQQLTLEQMVCEDHLLQKLEFFCKDCSKVVCSHCVICLHQGHGVITKKQKNEEGMADLDDAREKATEVMKRLLHTQKKLGDVLMVPAAGYKLTPVEQEVTRHFVYLHGALQLMEQNLMERLKSVKTESSRTLESVGNELNSNIQQVRQLILEAIAAKDPANIDKVEVAAVTKRLLAVPQFPCHLVTGDGSSADPSVRFIVDELFLAQIENHCLLEIHAANSYSLVKTEDLPTDYVIEPVDDETEHDAVMSTSSRTSSVSCISEAMSLSIEQTGSDQRHQATNKSARCSRNIVKGSSDIVTVCHLRDPSSFYVHRVADAVTLDNLSKQLSKHVHTFNTPPETVLRDGLYMVQYQEDGKWYRARVRGLLPSSSDNTTIEKLVDILYIDYGNSEIIPTTKLRCIPPKFAHTPAMALHCSLFDLAPCNGKWSQEAVRRLAMMVNGYDVKMVVMDHVADTCHVDLCQLPGDAQDSDVPVSVRDALVFLEHACFVTEIKPKATLSQRTMKYFQEGDFKKGDVVDVVVSHIESPHSFYIQRLGEHARYLTSVMKDMNSEYSNAGNKGFIYTPYVGMPCAAQYTIDKKWYRAKVIDLPGSKMVEVFYVDYGNQEVMAWNRIRKLQARFLRIAAQAIHCSLCDVVPNQPQWMPAVKEYLMKVTAKKILRLYIDEVQRLQLKVTLYESQAEVDLCINALLVRDGYATSVGVSSSLVEYHKLDGLPLPPPLCNIKKTHLNITKRKPVANLKAQPIGGFGDITVSKQSNTDKCEKVEDPFRLEVKVLSCPSPSCIYVALPIQEELINSLMCELQEYYATSSSNTENWEVNNKCCAFSVQRKQWYRAIIVEMLPNQQAKVFLKDFAEVEVVPLLNLQLLDPRFLSTRDGAIRCHLAGVQAAGDKTEWPGLACEYLAEQIAKYPNIYITKMGDIENCSLPVDLWVKRVKQAGPLDPTEEEWLTLNKKLAEQGLAIPVRRESEVQSVPSVQVLKELEERSQEENKDIVSDWLQLSVQMGDSLKTDSSDVALDVSHDGSSFSDIDDEAGVEQEDQPLSHAQSEWLLPVPVNKNQFTAIPTYVDDECYIYLHDTEKSSDTLTVIGNALHSRFKNSQPKPHDLYWFPGQLCIAQYHSDKKWYRGKVVGVNDDRTVKVLFVDYGNVEECKASEMRKNIYMTDIAIQCHKCQLDGIMPASEDGKWSLSTLDFVHTTIVEKQCHVTVKQDSKIGQPLVISLIGPGNINIAELLVRMQFAIYTSTSELDSETVTSEEAPSVIVEDEDTEVIVEGEGSERTVEDEEETREETNDKEAEINDKNVKYCSSPELDGHVQWNDLIDQEEGRQEVQKKTIGNVLYYKVLELPDCDTIAVEVTAILSATELIIHPCKVKDSELLKMKEKFESLTEDLQEQARSQPLIKKPYIGQPCCARYTEDDQWYRAAVLAIESDEAKQKMLKVQFVDYGNVEYQPMDKVHILKREWTAVPVQGLRCRMWRIERPHNWDPQVLFPKLMECLFHPPLLAKIKTRQPMLEVELFTSDGSTLVWKPLLNAGLLTMQKEEQSQFCDLVVEKEEQSIL